MDGVGSNHSGRKASNHWLCRWYWGNSSNLYPHWEFNRFNVSEIKVVVGLSQTRTPWHTSPIASSTSLIDHLFNHGDKHPNMEFNQYCKMTQAPRCPQPLFFSYFLAHRKTKVKLCYVFSYTGSLRLCTLIIEFMLRQESSYSVTTESCTESFQMNACATVAAQIWVAGATFSINVFRIF